MYHQCFLFVFQCIIVVFYLCFSVYHQRVFYLCLQLCCKYSNALHASVVHASGTGQLQANPHVAGPWLSPGKPTRRAVTTMGSTTWS